LEPIKDQFFMQRCLTLASKALGSAAPNPMVGAVVVYQNKIIGEGWHQKAGEVHAEVHAINQVSAEEILKKATLYVNLEPCSHFGKTPPCADLIIEKGIKKVVIASRDPNPLVSGKGIKKLKEAGITVVENILKEEADFLNRRFYTFHQKKRPYIILKWAETQDGYMAPSHKKEKKPYWISNALTKQKVHQWRTEEAAILVGVQTVIEDNPLLTAREWPGKNPLRMVLDPNNRMPADAALLHDGLPTFLFSNEKINTTNKQLTQQVLRPFDLDQLMEFCYEIKITSLFVEGGRKTLDSFIEAHLWEEARVFKSEKKLGEGLEAPKLKRPSTKEEKIGANKLKFYFK
jgi:diaminohydroxyphosphoribosylaminopyrimidine deaminase/5-amino-6-(5-phosphoribosylamino)uracil reductase